MTLAVSPFYLSAPSSFIPLNPNPNPVPNPNHNPNPNPSPRAPSAMNFSFKRVQAQSFCKSLYRPQPPHPSLLNPSLAACKNPNIGGFRTRAGGPCASLREEGEEELFRWDVAEALRRVRVVLVEPQGALNVGMVARAMANFGLEDLVLVRPGGSAIDFQGPDARRMACHAGSVLDNARPLQTLSEALEGVTRTLATSGRPRGPPLPPLEVLGHPHLRLSPPTDEGSHKIYTESRVQSIPVNSVQDFSESSEAAGREISAGLNSNLGVMYEQEGTSSVEGHSMDGFTQKNRGSSGRGEPVEVRRASEMVGGVRLEEESCLRWLLGGEGELGRGGEGGSNRRGTGRGSGSGRAAVLFGREDSGLSNDELSYAQRTVAIPTSPLCPSINLSHAVAVLCLQLSQEAHSLVTERRGWEERERVELGGHVECSGFREEVRENTEAVKNHESLHSVAVNRGDEMIGSGGSIVSPMNPPKVEVLKKTKQLDVALVVEGEEGGEGSEGERSGEGDMESESKGEREGREQEAASISELENYLQHLEKMLLTTTFLLPHTAPKRMAKLRRLLLRAMPSKAELALLFAITSKTSGALQRSKAASNGNKKKKAEA